MPPEFALELNQITTRYPGQRCLPPVLSDLNLQLHWGCCQGVIGLSGDGKTTALRVAEGALRPDAGQVLLQTPRGIINLYNGPAATRWAARRHIGVVDQMPELNPFRKICDIVNDPLRIHGLDNSRSRAKRVAAMLEQVGLKDGNRFPRDLSGGERQRVALARALIANPEVLLLDEPTSALDILNAKLLVEILESLLADRRQAVLLVSHDLGLVRRLCQRVAVLDKGRIVEEGPVEYIFEHPLSEKSQELIGYAARLSTVSQRAGKDITRSVS